MGRTGPGREGEGRREGGSAAGAGRARGAGPCPRDRASPGAQGGAREQRSWRAERAGVRAPVLGPISVRLGVRRCPSGGLCVCVCARANAPRLSLLIPAMGVAVFPCAEEMRERLGKRSTHPSNNAIISVVSNNRGGKDSLGYSLVNVLLRPTTLAHSVGAHKIELLSEQV